MFLRLIFAVLCFLLVAMSISAEIPNVVNYQGHLKDDAGEPVTNGLYLIRFRLYDASGGTLWDSDFQSIQVTNGFFTYLMGENVAIPNTVFANNSDVWLGLQVGADPEMSPLTKLSSVPFALNALNSDTAENAKMLNNNLPSYYLDWNNQTNIPDGFADGVDDVGEGSDITSVFPEAGGGLVGGGTSGDVVLGIATNGIASDKILDNTLTDIDFNSEAEIEPSKIKGTAVNLEDVQTITTEKTFNGLKIIPTTRRLAVPAAAFDVIYSSDPYTRGSGSLMNGNIDDIQQYHAPVCLPDGATVIQVIAHFYDDDVDGYGWIYMIKKTTTNGNSTQMASLGTSGSPGFTTTVDNSITSGSVNNNGYNFYLIAEMQWRVYRNGLKLFGVEIVYTITKPLP